MNTLDPKECENAVAQWMDNMTHEQQARIDKIKAELNECLQPFVGHYPTTEALSNAVSNEIERLEDVGELPKPKFDFSFKQVHTNELIITTTLK